LNKEDEIKFYKFLENLFEPEELEILKKVVKKQGEELISDDF
jgi:hypothetical protein